MITLIANDEQVTNVYGFRVANEKLNFNDFNANPVMLYNHDIDRVIGICENIRIEGSQLKFDPKFDEKDPNQDVIATSEIEFIISNIPVGVMRKVKVKIGFKTSL